MLADMFTFGTRRVVWMAWTPTRSVSTPSLGSNNGSSLDHPWGHDRALREGRTLRSALEHRRFRDERRLMAGRRLRAKFHPCPPIAARTAGPRGHVRERSGRRARKPVDKASL